METNNYPNWLVNVGQAKRLKEIGFDIPCAFVLTNKDRIGFTTNESNQYHLFEELDLNSNSESSLVCIPTYEQALEWFREKEFIGVIDYYFDILRDKPLYKYEIKNIIGQVIFTNKEIIETYKEALGLLINQLIEIYLNSIISEFGEQKK